MVLPIVAVPVWSFSPFPETVMVPSLKLTSSDANRGELSWMKFRKSSNVFPDPGAPNPAIKLEEYIVIYPLRQSEYPALHRDRKSGGVVPAPKARAVTNPT